MQNKALLLFALFVSICLLVPTKNASGQNLPLEQLLQKDGTLNLSGGLQGIVDMKGWQMNLRKDGTPVFSPTSAGGDIDPDDQFWDARFGYDFRTGSGTRINAIAVRDGWAYFGGMFTSAGGQTVSNVAAWNGSMWDAMGTSGTFTINGEVMTIAVGENGVYVGGQFSSVGGIPNTKGIAMWSGTNWSALGPGIDVGYGIGVWSIATYGGIVYVGGKFQQIGSTTMNNIAKWNGSQWSALGSGLGYVGGTEWVHCIKIASDGQDVYAGGWFGGSGLMQNLNNIARWSEKGQNWNQMGNGLYGGGGTPQVATIIIDGGYVYAGGKFHSGASPFHNVARWDGSQWWAIGLGTGYVPFTSPSIRGLAVHGGYLYAAGEFTGLPIDGAPDIPALHIARCYLNSPTLTWEPIIVNNVNGVNDVVYSISLSFDGNLLVAGSFTTVGDISTNWLAGWTGTSWFGFLGQGLNGNVFSVTVNGSNIYVGGSFTRVGYVDANHIAVWNGNTWSSLGAGTNGTVYSIAVNGSGVFAGGNFSTAGQGYATNIAKWNGSSWSPLGTVSASGDPLDTVYALCLIGNGSDLYAGGKFPGIGGTTCSNIAKWDGTSWAGVGNPNGTVRALIGGGSFANHFVYAGGDFTSIGEAAFSHVAEWTWYYPVGSDETLWHSLGTGVDKNVRALAFAGTDVIAAGNFTTAGGSSANYVAKWNSASSSWSALSTGTNDYVSNVAVISTQVYAGGNFTQAGGSTANRIAMWNGTGWSKLGSGTNSTVNAIGLSGPANNTNVYAGGAFTVAGAKQSYYFGRWNKPSAGDQPMALSTPSSDNLATTPREFALEQNYPNPFNPSTQIRYQLPSQSFVSLKIFDILGREVATLVNEEKEPGTYSAVWNAKDAASGMYFYRLTAGAFTEVKKLMVLK